MTAGNLHDVLAEKGAALMVQAIAALEAGTLQFSPQSDSGITYAAKIDKAETRVDWSKPWQEVHNHIRGLSSFPGAWCEMPGAGRVKLLRTTTADGSGDAGKLLDDRLTVACRSGAIRILELQRAGKQPMKAEEFLRGASLCAGLQLA